MVTKGLSSEQLASINLNNLKENIKKEDSVLNEYLEKLTTLDSISCYDYLNMSDTHFNLIKELLHINKDLYFMVSSESDLYIQQLTPEQKRAFEKLKAIRSSKSISSEIQSIKNPHMGAIGDNISSSHF